MISQANCTPATPMGATLLSDQKTLLSDQGVSGAGATFRAWAPRASAVYVNGVFGGVTRFGQTPDLLLAKDANGYWSGFLPDAADGDPYHFYVVGQGSSGYKRDPYARELANDPTQPFPLCPAVLRAANAYPWHDAGFRTPDYADMVVYQLHIGTYAPAAPGRASTFLDVLQKVEYLAALGVNVVQPLPVYEEEDSPSQGYPGLGYQGADLFSPATEYAVYDETELASHLDTINRLLAAKGFAPITLAEIAPANAQLKAMVDLLHVYGIAVVFDVVYNHAGGFNWTYRTPRGTIDGDDRSLYFWDRARPTDANGNFDNNQSLYFTDKGFVGGLAFALWNREVRGFLLNNARFHLQDLHADGFRYDEIGMMLAMNATNGWEFCNELTAAVRSENPRALQNAEYWPDEYGVPAPRMVVREGEGGLRFDAVQHDGLREAIRSAIGQAAHGENASVDMSGIARSLWPAGFSHSWQAIPCVENHDIVKLGEKPRIPRLADSSNPRSWYARSRTRVAMALLLAAPGIPQIFMGQEFLEDKQWCPDPRLPDLAHLIWWGGLEPASNGCAVDPAMADHLRFTHATIALRNAQPALRGEGLNAFYTADADRVLAFHRWIQGQGHDVVVVATLSETTLWNYRLGFPAAGRWVELFNSDAYDSCNANGLLVNPQVAGNRGGIAADGPPLQNMPASATIVIPANAVLVFARQS